MITVTMLSLSFFVDDDDDTTVDTCGNYVIGESEPEQTHLVETTNVVINYLTN